MLKKIQTLVTKRGMRLKFLFVAVVAFLGVTMVSCGDEPDGPPIPGGYYDTYYLEGYYEGQYRDGAVLAWMFYSDGSGYNRWVNVPSNPYSNTFRDHYIRGGSLYIWWDGDRDYSYAGQIELGYSNYFNAQLVPNYPWISFYRQ
ncbi:MAG: hypothetical protein K1V76_00530 [Candidatus Amulumruptor sp.]